MGIIPDNHRYHFGLLGALRLAPAPAPGAAAASPPPAAAAPLSATAALAPDFAALTAEQRQRLGEVYAELQTQHPHSAACQRLPLDFLEGEAFLAAAQAYVRRYVQKGIPSLFRDLRPLYADAAKRDALGRLLTELEQSYAAEAEAAGAAAAAGGGSEVAGATPPAEQGQQAEQEEQGQQQHGHGHHSHHHHHKQEPLLWVRLYLAQHHDLLGDTAQALLLIDQCIEVRRGRLRASEGGRAPDP